MARVYGNLISGLFSGRIGNIVGVVKNGKQYFRQLPKKNSKKPSEKQIIQRARFRFAMGFIKSLSPVIKIGFNSKYHSRSPQNMAMSLLLQNALEGEYPEFTVNYKKLQLAKGPVETCYSDSVKIIKNDIVFNWSNYGEYHSNYKNDHAILVAISEDNQTFFSINDYCREDKGGKLSISCIQSGTKVHCYTIFNDANNSELSSNSLYVGTVIMP